MTKPQNTAAIEKATGRSFEDWCTLLDKLDGKKRDHALLADIVFDHMPKGMETAGWWAQGVAVAYEQHIGRREPGQRSDGSYENSISRTFMGVKEEVFEHLVDEFGAHTTFADEKASNVRTSITPVRSYWKCDLADGTKVTVAVESRGENKSACVVTTSGITTAEQADHWRAYWKKFLAAL